MKSLRTLAALCCLVPLSMFGQTIGWGDTDVHYSRSEKPAFEKKAFNYQVWKGETAFAEAVIWADRAIDGAEVVAGALSSGKYVIPASEIKAEFVSYITGDELAEKYNQCGERDTISFKKISEADLIGYEKTISLKAGEARPVWLTVNVPDDAPAGKYVGKIVLRAESSKDITLVYTLDVADRVLPPAGDDVFHLDLWENPYSIARYYGVEPWSDEHFRLMRPVMKRLADAGGRTITATLLDRPWDGQTEDPFGPMILKIKRIDGTWLYDYTVFDKWVEFMMELGFGDQINCYSLIPWKSSYDYFDQATYSVKTVSGLPGEDSYNEYWRPFIKDFSAHLHTKGWFSKTCLAMDERSEKDMRAALDLVQSIEPDFKISLAGNYHESIEAEIFDLCIGFRQDWPEGVVGRRRSEGKKSTYYTCCAEKFPNTFIASQPSEAYWIPFHTLEAGLDGYLRWAFNSWTIDPFHDARFRTWAAGDCYMVYPDGLTGIRFNKLTEGLQDYRKALVLRKEWGASKSAAASKKLAALEAAISRFTDEDITENGATPAVKQVRAALSAN